jgi:hypothetical protein
MGIDATWTHRGFVAIDKRLEVHDATEPDKAGCATGFRFKVDRPDPHL